MTHYASDNNSAIRERFERLFSRAPIFEIDGFDEAAEREGVALRRAFRRVHNLGDTTSISPRIRPAVRIGGAA